MQEQMVGASQNQPKRSQGNVYVSDLIVSKGGNVQDSLIPDQRIEWKGKDKKKQQVKKIEVQKSKSVHKKSIGNPYHRSIFEEPPQ